MLDAVRCPLARLPLYLRYVSQLTFAEPVQSTRQLPEAARLTIRFDETYTGLGCSPLEGWIGLYLLRRTSLPSMGPRPFLVCYHG